MNIALLDTWQALRTFTSTLELELEEACKASAIAHLSLHIQMLCGVGGNWALFRLAVKRKAEFCDTMYDFMTSVNVDIYEHSGHFL